MSREPPEFLDALMNTIMTDPVRLPGSGKYVVRACGMPALGSMRVQVMFLHRILGADV